jgi:hypothetical protein
MSPLSIHVVTIAAHEHRYPTSGDWFWRGNMLCVSVTRQRDIKRTFLLAMHEVIEGFACKLAGIGDDVVTEFDMKFTKRNKRTNKEPGDHPKAPYKRQHQLAEKLERALAEELGVNWPNYLKGMR